MKNQDTYQTIFEDDDIIVINKPSGILSIPDRYDHTLPSLYKILGDIYEKIFVVHRLDKGTSGIMVFAKNAESHKSLNDQFQNQEITKIYHAILKGRMIEDKMEVDIPLAHNPRKAGQMIPSARGKESLSIIKILESFRAATLAEVNLISGRQHQLRVHCSAIGNPLIVDDIYGDSSEFYVSSVKRRFNLKKGTEEKPIMNRISMHARSLKFNHPETSEQLEFQAEYPKDFAAVLQVLRKYASIV